MIVKVGRLVPYLIIPGAGAASPFLVIPAVTSSLGVSGWEAMAVAQALGTAAGVIGEVGWGVIGPQRVAAATTEGRLKIYRESLASRIPTTLAASLVAALLTFGIVGDYQFEASLLAATTAWSAVGPSWFFIGAAKPSAVLASVSFPKLFLSAVAAFGILYGHGLGLYAALTGLQAITALVIARLYLGKGSEVRSSDWRAAPAIWRDQRVITFGRAMSVLFTTAPVAIVGAFAPAVLSVFSAVDRLARMSLTILNGVPSRFQSWLGHATADNIWNRIRFSVVSNSLMGLICGIFFGLLIHPVSRLVYSGTVTIDLWSAIMGGALVFVVCTSRGLGLVLVSVGKHDAITYGLIPAGLLILLTIVSMSHTFGSAGALASGVMAECVAIGIQATSLYISYRRRF